MCGHNTESTEHFLLNCFLYSYERNNLLSNLTGVLEKQPATMTKENLLKALLMGERNDDPLNYKHNKKNIQLCSTLHYKDKKAEL